MTIPLHPLPEINHDCPRCTGPLHVQGWYMPGMWTLAVLLCQHCEKQFFADLPTGHGLYYPSLIEKGSGAVYGPAASGWFARWLKDAYAKRSSRKIEMAVEERREVRRPILFNCLDRLYGHSLLKLLNVQRYLDDSEECDVVVLIPKSLRWLVPDGVAVIWSVDTPFLQGAAWNDRLAEEINQRVSAWQSCDLAVTYAHPHPTSFAIERFSRIKPFPLDEWESRLASPVITFIIREDRWWGLGECPKFLLGVQNRLVRLMRKIVGGLGWHPDHGRIIRLAGSLRDVFPVVDFAVAGLGKPGGLPKWIGDLRLPAFDSEQETLLCQRYARSHVVIGVHGSNLLLPSAHAGAVISLLPEDRLGNILQDWLIRPDDQRETLFRYRALPIDTGPRKTAKIISSLLCDYPSMLLRMKRSMSACASGQEDHSRSEAAAA